MAKLNRSLQFSLIVILCMILPACQGLFRNKEQVFHRTFEGVTFEGFQLGLTSIHKKAEVWFYEPIVVSLRNDLEDGIALEESAIHLLTFQPKEDAWIEVPFRLLEVANDQEVSLPFKVNKGGTAFFMLLPEYSDDPKMTEFRVVITASLASDQVNQRPQGSYVDIPVRPAPGMNYGPLSIKKSLPALQKVASLWRGDAYLVAVRIGIPEKGESPKWVAVYTFQSPTSETMELSLSMDAEGRISQAETTYPDGLEKDPPISNDEWNIDGPEALNIVMQHDPSITWPGDKCQGIQLYRNRYKDTLGWEFYSGPSCAMDFKFQYIVDPLTGEIKDY